MAQPSFKVTDTDKGWAELAAKVNLLANNKSYAVVGVLGSQAAAPHSRTRGLTVGQLANIHEFGTSRIPARSFIRAGLDENQVPIQKRAVLLTGAVLTGKLPLGQALGLLGEYAVGVIKQRIANRIPPPNAPSTIRRKGSSVPLIETGQLRNSITYKIEAG